MSSLPRSTPESQGLSTGALDAFVAALDASDQEIQTLSLVRHGHVVLAEQWAPYRWQDPHLLFSVSKSFTSMAIGLLVDAGRLSVGDQVISFFGADELPEQISANLAAMQLRHLLTMTTGHAQDTVEALNRDHRMIRIFLGLEVQHEPGTHFVYNSGATYLLSVIVQRVSGEKLLDFLRPRLFEPLGAHEAIWAESKEGYNTGGWGLSLNTESLTNFSQLLLRRGVWEGRQLLPAAWIDEATKKQVDNSVETNPDWRQGYGYQFWRARHNAYRGDGAFGQYCLVFPDHDATLVITSSSPDMQAVMDLVWEHLLPAFEGGAGDGTPRPEVLELLPPTGADPVGNGRTYEFEPNHTGVTSITLAEDGSVTLAFQASTQAEYLTVTEGAMELVCRPGDWQETLDTLQEPPQRLATSVHGDGETAVVTIRYLETPFVVTLRCRPDGDRLVVEVRFNVGFGPLQSTLTSK
ncbi:serine hydrolase domain-containing protein [Kribbella sp. CA-293567]|uniref:serine hydrolase domain-containing protein n=1 Tax=Kribbella sp. CA-293567 TaxID=3002436 RepID=UPI0022DD95A0|nr:serine hydrolase [Kribbella sp. CA-293567]WBQ02696.1 serine hydrolase [Kribbella sp. CA-293567]